MTQDTIHDRNQTLPQLVIDETHCDQLLDLAYGAMRRFPDVAARLLEEIDRAIVVDADKMPAHVVTIGSEVTYRDNTTGLAETVTLVFPRDADIAQGRASVLTPIGAALIGLAEGDTLDWTIRSGKRRLLTVLTVRPPE
ncbi:MAG: nucleoside diphosphate kinase regulator [Sphingomonadales bacterium]